jgi:hypothetical protein
MYRHIRQSCKIANTEEGMEKLADFSLQRQLAELKQDQAMSRARDDRMTMLLEKQQAMLMALMTGEGRLAIEAAAAPVLADSALRPIGAAAQINNGPVVNNTDARVVNNIQHVVNQVQIIAPWDSDKRLNLGVKDMIAAFSENARLREFASLPDHEMADPEIGGPFVLELFMDLVRRAHSDPMVRNVYLNPRRTDQALVYHNAGKWEVFPLPETIRLLLDGVSEKIRPIILTPGLCGQLPLEAQNALAIAGMLYEEAPDKYARKARGLMSAHLANMAPGR